ncbi:MAG: PHP domain-containing protein, partial [Rhodobacteraceae bacterium]|nr:PHP domain-containing protein [Paracoccaceae bacterium]
MNIYAELQCITNFSFLRGASHPHELVEEASRLGHSAIAIADHNSLAGVVRAHIAAKKAGLKLLVGSRINTLGGDNFLCFPQNRAAWGRLSKLLTRGKLAAPKGECYLSLDEVLGELEDCCVIALTVLSPCEENSDSSPIHSPLQSPPFRGRLDPVFASSEVHTSTSNTFLTKLKAAAPDNLWLAANYLYHGDDRRRLLRLQEISARMNIPLVATNDVHYHVASRRVLQDVVTCIREKCTIEEAGFRLAANSERHLKSLAEMARLFSSHPQAIDNIATIIDRCNFSLDELSYNYPNEPVPAGKTPQQHLENLTWQGAR